MPSASNLEETKGTAVYFLLVAKADGKVEARERKEVDGCVKCSTGFPASGAHVNAHTHAQAHTQKHNILLNVSKDAEKLKKKVWSVH